MACVRILIADDHELVREGLRALLASRPAWEVCGEAADGVEAIEKAAELQPDIVLLDVSMPRLSGLEAAALIRRESPTSEILIVSQHDPAEMLASALKAGARGFVSKSDIASNLLSTIESIVGPARRAAANGAEPHVVTAAVPEGGERGSLAPAWEHAAALPGPLDPKRQHAERLLLEQNHLLELIARGRPLDQCLRAITESVAHLQPGVRAAIALLDGNRTRVERIVSSRLPAALTAQLCELPIVSDSAPIPCSSALARGELCTCPDIAVDARWSAPWRELCIAHGVRALHTTPVWNADGIAIASFFVCLGEAREPNAWERDLVQFGAHLGSVAIERWRAEAALQEARDHLESRVRERTEELEKAYKSLRVLSMRMMQMQDEDRRRIARDLHDSAGQLLAALGMELASLNGRAAALSRELAEDINSSLQLVEQLTQEIRTASYLLHPPLLDDAGLSGALRWYVTGLSKRSGIAITLELDECLGRLPRELEAAVFHIVQESLTNIHRHSGSRTAVLRIARTGGRLLLDIEDQGRGIPAEILHEIQTQGSGVGIAGMRERVLHFNGDIRITSQSTGTRVAVTFPVEPGGARADSRSLDS
ncbi:MAG TPA: response regulator [Steroidobacteraceae bacterium]|nr:response regulator [Steroidobacteraceae bacterium]